jgi:heat shock protein HtpX
MKRIVLFVGTNLAVVVLLTVVTSLLGVDRWLVGKGINYYSLLILSLVLGFAGSFISLAISKWMAKMAYRIQVIREPANADEQWLVGKIGELAAKAEIRMPEVGIYESPEANAFATGPSRRNSLVAVSTGLLRQMHPREVEGVLAHEIAHIANGDMVTMTLLQGTLNTFVIFLSRVIGFAVDQFMRRGDDDRGVGVGYFVGYLVSEIVLGLLATMIVMGYSRRREFRADAMAAELEGPQAMIGALRRLQMIAQGGAVVDPRAPSLSTLKIAHPGRVMRLFSSHPPLEERIAALERRR